MKKIINTLTIWKTKIPYIKIIIALILNMFILNTQATAKEMGLFTQNQIDSIKQKVINNEQPVKSAYDSLISLADFALTQTHEAKETLIAYAFYYSTQAQKDETHNNYKRLEKNVNYTYQLALAYKLTGDAKYADKALYFLDSWATINKAYKGGGFDRSADPDATCNYKCANWYDQTGADLHMTTKGLGFIQAAILLRNYPGFDNNMKERFSSWVINVYRKNTDTYLHDSIEFRDNSASWANLGRILSHIWLQDDKALQDDIAYTKNTIVEQINSAAILPKEVDRGATGMWYTYFTLAPMSASAMIIYNETGENLFKFKNSSGVTIENALDVFFGHSVNTTTFPWKNGSRGMLPTPSNRGGDIFESLSFFLNKPEWRAWTTSPLTNFSSHVAWSVPTLSSTVSIFDSSDQPLVSTDTQEEPVVNSNPFVLTNGVIR